MRREESGYALLLAIFVVAALSFAALAAARAQGDAMAALSGLAERESQAVVAESVAAQIAFALMTEPLGPRSLLVGRDSRGRSQELRLDGRSYAVAPELRFSVQDEAGVFNLNSPDQTTLAGLLRAVGFSADADMLAARLLDHTDEDDVERVRGGEAGAPNRPLASRWQALEVRDWAALERTRIWDWVTAGPATATLNANTAPVEVLAAAFANRRRAQEIVARREAAPITDVGDVEALTGGVGRADGLTLAALPGPVFRIQIAFAERNGVEKRVRLTSGEGERPFVWIEERRGLLSDGGDGGVFDFSTPGAPAS